MQEKREPFRILAIGETWFGSDARSAFSALRRLGHVVNVIDENHYIPNTWQRAATRVMRKIFRSLLVRELSMEAVAQAESFQPDCLFVFKGNGIHPAVLKEFRRRGIATINFYPDVSFLSHGPYIPKALPLYDHIFTTKSYGLIDMPSALRIQSISLLPPGFDPEVHYPLTLTSREEARYGCDVAFIGTWSPKKEKLLDLLVMALPHLKVRIWGNQWNKCVSTNLHRFIMGTGITGTEYTKAICAAKICLGLLSEAGLGSSSGDLITARTFQIPACGTFMLHERNTEVAQYFAEGIDAEFFSSPDELAEKISFYLGNHQRRHEVANNGLNRSRTEDYSIDARMHFVISWLARHTNNGFGAKICEGL